MNGIRLAAAAAVAVAVALGATGSTFAADKKASHYFVYKTKEGCSVVMDANKKTPGKKLAGPFKTQGGADKRLAKLTKEKKC